MATTECKGGKSITDFCHRKVSFAYTKDRKDLIVNKEFKIHGRNRLVITCSYCKKPPIQSANYIQFCGGCEWYYRGSPESESCEECKEVF